MTHSFDKKEFFDRIEKILSFREKEGPLTISARETEIEIGEIENKRSSIKDELIKTLFMTKGKKEKLNKELEKLQKTIDEKNAYLESIDRQITEMTVEYFGSDEIPPIYMGTFPQGENGEEMKLEWDVLLKSNGYAHLVTRRVIRQMRYAEEFGDTAWKDSRIRNWLNGSFFEKTFNDEEKALIKEKELANPGCPQYTTPASENTVDRVFLASISEVKSFSKYDIDRIAKPTAYAKKDLYVDEETHGCYWWLRNNGGNMYNASIVNFKGYVFEYGFYVSEDKYGVRPNIWVKIDT